MKFEALAKSFTKKELPDSEVEFVGEIPSETIVGYRSRALSHIAEHLDLPGFRKGHVSPEVALKKVGEIAVLEESVEIFMRDFYPDLLEVQKLDVIGPPNIRITKLAPGNPVGLSIRAAIFPKLTLPKDWRAIAGKVEIETVSDILDAEVEEALLSIRRARAKSADPAAPKNAPQAEIKEEDLPALDDAFATSLGQFSDVADLRVKLRENMKMEKEQKAKESRRGKIVEALLDKTTVAVPAIFVESELDKIMGQMKEDVSRFGMNFDEYLKRMSKTEEGVRNDFREQAKKRAKLQLTLNHLAQEEKIEADKDAVNSEMKHALQHFPDARQDLLRVHIETVLRNEKVLQLLEKGNQ